MNNPDDVAIDVEEMRQWANAYRDMHKLSWSRFALLLDVKAGTLQPWCTGIYVGRQEPTAKAVFRLRQFEQSQRELTYIGDEPRYFETATSRRIGTLLNIAQSGRITLAGTSPGTGKSITARYYASAVNYCWLATMRKSTRSLNAMTERVIRALDVEKPPRGNNTAALTEFVIKYMRGKRGLLIVDEAQHLDEDGLEELRAWHDETNVGLCLLGNEELVARIRNGTRGDAFARMNSRIAQSHIVNACDPEDVEVFCDEWRVADPGMRKLLLDVGTAPGAGGLRECRQLLETASMLAADDDRPISLADLNDAQATRATRNIRA